MATNIDVTRRPFSVIAADKVQGTAVYDADGNRLGSIEYIMLDKIGGRVAYAVLSFGGFLGIGEKYHPLPWDVLRYDPVKGGYVINMTRAQLERAPTIDAKDSVDWENEAWGERVYGHYGVQRYWL
ncbi:MAG: PRC-barrel domain-containing protein [Alphaproteobacteria bacterium]|nr:PRC-barrel domain-containing protein [Alphaproteobacteria bacterium]